MNESINCLC